MENTGISKNSLCKLSIGSKIWFIEERQGYTVRATGKQYLILTKPFNPKKTVLYTILDVEQMIRGRENLIFCAGAETDEQCQDMVARLIDGETEISSRYVIAAHISKIVQCTSVIK